MCFEVNSLIAKERRHPPVECQCKRQFLVVMVGVLGVKSLVEHNGEG